MPDEIFYRSYLNRDRLVHICDPDLSICEQLSVLFRLEGFQTMFSINLPGFLAMLERRRPDVVVANFDLGTDPGLDLLRRVKHLRMGTPVFMLENAPMVEAAVQAMKDGASDVVTKPIDTEHLVRIVRDALRQDIHVGAVQSGGRPVEVRGFAQLTPTPSSRRSPRASARCCSSSPTVSPTRKPAASSAFRPAPSKCTAPASWKSSAPATPPI